MSSAQMVLDAEPRSASRARATVRDLLVQAGLDDLVDEAMLLVSEVVTNAVLHAATRIDLACTVASGRVRVAVHDGSPVLPGRRHYQDDAMTGRGLAMVERVASAWGVQPRAAGGKTVWFELVIPDRPADDPMVASRPDQAAPEQAFTLRLRDAPVGLLATTVQYGDTLLRELVFTALAEAGDHLIPSWQAAQIDLAPVLDAVHAAKSDDAPVTDVDVALPPGSGTAAQQRLVLIEEADQMARDGKLLTIPELPEVSACRRWLLREIARQDEGLPPVPWTLPDPTPPTRPAAALAEHHRRRLDRLGTPALVADESNRILHANAEASALLGWEPGALSGSRLIAIVPERLREAHLAGFGRYLLTREPRLVGRRTHLPALRADGSEILVALTITLLDMGDGPLAFLATFADPAAADEPAGDPATPG